MEYKTFKSRVVGIQFAKDVFDESRANQYIQDHAIKGGKVKPSYDGKFLGVKLSKGKAVVAGQNVVVPSSEQGVHYLIQIDAVVKKPKPAAE